MILEGPLFSPYVYDGFEGPLTCPLILLLMPIPTVLHHEFGHWDHDTWPVTRLVSPARKLRGHTKKPKRPYILSGWLREPTVPCHQQQFHNIKWPASMWYSGRLTVWCVVVNGIRFRETRRNYSSILSFYVFFSHSYKLHLLILLVHYPSLNFTSSWVGGDYFNVLELGTDEPSMQHD